LAPLPHAHRVSGCPGYAGSGTADPLAGQSRIRQGAARRLHNDPGAKFIGAMGQPLTSEDIADFRATFAGRLSPRQTETLVRWYQEEIVPRLRGARS